jgi:transposase-like protein
MTLKNCPGCKVLQTTKNAKKDGRNVFGLYFTCKSCQSSFLIRVKDWKKFLLKEAI